MKVIKKVAGVKGLNDYMTNEQYSRALSGVGLELEGMVDVGVEGMKGPDQKIYKNSLKFTGHYYGISLAFEKADADVIKYYEKKYYPPTFKRVLVDYNTPYNYKNSIKSIFDKGLKNHWNWQKVITETKAFVNPVSGTNFPRWMYSRIVRTETARYVVAGHLSGAKKMGFTHMRRLVTVDDATDEDLCLPFENYLYTVKEASGLLPRHPHCRCDIVPEPVGG